jgi:hypothetical protein
MRSVENNTQISPLKLFLLQAKPYVSLVNKSPNASESPRTIIPVTHCSK